MSSRSRSLSLALFGGLLSALVGTLLPTTALSPAHASVSTAESWQFTDGKLPLVGHGFGHGHGMSQYGAAGAARRGLTESQILSFYYPGTRQARFEANIAVLITADTSDDLVVAWQKGMRVRDRGTGAVRELPALRNVTRWRLVVVSGATRVQYYSAGAWRAFKVGDRYAFAGDGEFSAPSGRLSLVLPGNVVRSYRGVLRHARPSATSTRRDTVNVLGIDAYVRGVVPAEMPASWHPEAVQAQAIAARSYALHERAANLKRHYQICDTTSCQVYKGIAGEHPDATKAVAATSRIYLTYGGKPAFTQFSASSGGWLSAGSRPYLVSKRDPYDAWAGNAVHTWRTTISASTLARRYPSLGTIRGLTITRREGGGDWKGRVESLTVRGSKGTKQLSGNDLRSIYGLRSTWFTRG